MPDGTIRDDILDFYISELSPEWQWCFRYFSGTDESGQMASGGVMGAHFIKGMTRVSINTYDLHRRVGRMKRTYYISVDHNETINPCRGAE